MWRYAVFGAWAAALAALPLLGELYVVRMGIGIAMFSTLALSWNIIGGYMGYPSFSTVAFFGLGAYAGALSQLAGYPMFVSWIIATLVVIVVSWGLSFAVLRLRGHYFAIGTIAVVEIFRLTISAADQFTGGGDGLNVPFYSGRPADVLSFFLYVMVGLMAIAFVMCALIERSRLGFGLHCIRQNEDASEMVGIATKRYKIIAYILSSMLCGTVGAAYASWTGYIDPTDSFNIVTTLKVPVMVMLGGLGTLLGPVLGAGVFVIVEEILWAEFLDWHRALIGVVIVAVIFLMPGGLVRLPGGLTRLGRAQAGKRWGGKGRGRIEQEAAK